MMDAIDEPIGHFESMALFARTLKAMSAQLFEHRYDCNTFFSWMTVFSIRDKVLRVGWEGRDRQFSLDESATVTLPYQWKRVWYGPFGQASDCFDDVLRKLNDVRDQLPPAAVTRTPDMADAAVLDCALGLTAMLQFVRSDFVADLHLEDEFTITVGAKVHRLSLSRASDVRPFLELLHAVAADATVDDAGGLEVRFVDGRRLQVSAGFKFEARGVLASDGHWVISTPKGQTRHA